MRHATDRRSGCGAPARWSALRLHRGEASGARHLCRKSLIGPRDWRPRSRPRRDLTRRPGQRKCAHRQEFARRSAQFAQRARAAQTWQKGQISWQEPTKIAPDQGFIERRRRDLNSARSIFRRCASTPCPVFPRILIFRPCARSDWSRCDSSQTLPTDSGAYGPGGRHEHAKSTQNPQPWRRLDLPVATHPTQRRRESERERQARCTMSVVAGRAYGPG
jgi:hypothetical protein